MSDLSVIILTKDEELHIGRCLERLLPLFPREIFIVDSLSTDRTAEIVRSFGDCHPNLSVQFVPHAWPGNQAAQFNWALDTLPVSATWILRLDADEYLFPETCSEVVSLLADEMGGGDETTSFSMTRARRFLGGDIRFGGRNVELVRFFRRGCGRSEDREMDEHIVTLRGKNRKLKGWFIDDSLISFESWREKHRNYAAREARQVVADGVVGNKWLYYRLPPYVRAFAYFCYRYFIRLGILDGIAGWRWNFWQGLWYRCLVDRKIAELKRNR